MKISLLGLVVCLSLLTACPRRAEPPPPAPKKSPLSELCRRQITAAFVHAELSNEGPGRWSVTLDIGGAVLEKHEARFRNKTYEPNGEAWAGVLEQCLTRSDPAALRGVALDPEAGSLHAWVQTAQDKDRWVAALCRAIEDTAWLDHCLATVDRSLVDD
jgi:hypothetical protein